MQYIKSIRLFTTLTLYASILLAISACSSSGSFTGFSYDPEGATVTTDKQIQPHHRRTIGIAADSIWLTNEFEGSRMSDFYRENDSTFTVLIEPENYPVNNSPWYSFKLWSEGIQDTSQYIRLKLTYKHGKHRYWPDLSHDGQSWSPMDSSRYLPDTLSGTATLRLPVSTDTLWVSAQELVTLSDYKTWMYSINRQPFAGLDTVGYTHRRRPITRLTIGDTSDQHDKGVLIITGRQHPPEVTGAMASLIFLEEVASDNELAKRFRSRFLTIAYPVVNPDGVQNGHWRHNAAGVDLNRDWMAFNQPETQAVRDDLVNTIKNNSRLKVYYGIDFHSTDENIFYPINRDIKTFPENFSYRWIDSLKAEYPDMEFAVEPFDTGSPITKNWIYKTFGADAITYEVNDRIDRKELEVVSRSAARIIMHQLLDEMGR